jgi:hypothetical protein
MSLPLGHPQPLRTLQNNKYNTLFGDYATLALSFDLAPSGGIVQDGL